MSQNESEFAPGDALAPLFELSHRLSGLTSELLLGFVLGVLSARAMRAAGLHWGWAALAAMVAVALRVAWEGLGAMVLCAASLAAARGRRWHREDLQAGADLARIAVLRRRPQDLLRSLLRGRLLRRRRLGKAGWDQGGKLILGSTRDGGLLSMPFGGAGGGTHTLLVGATGSGKTVTQTWLAVRAIGSGMGAVVVDPKGDRAMRDALVRAARAARREFVDWTPDGPSIYNPLAHGTDTEIADKVLAGERFTEPHYLRQAQRYLGHVVRGLRACGVETSLRAIVGSLDPAGLELLARALPEPAARETHAYLDSLTPRQLSDMAGVRDRLSILVESEVGRWLDPEHAQGRRFDLLTATRRSAVVYFDLDADRRPLLTQMLGAAIVQDLQTTVAALQGDPIPTVVIIDEFSALAAEQVVRLFGRARSAGMSLVLSTQELADLRLPGHEAVLDQVLGNLTVLLAHRQVVPRSAELVCGLAGTKGVWRTSQQDRGKVTRTRSSEGVLDPCEVMGLPPGWVAAIVLGEGADTRVGRVFSSRDEGEVQR
jgi:type IV secretory pathway TraG/TraD family ATPase VirD4